MGKHAYYFGISLGVINVALLLFQMLLFLRLGEQFYALPSFLPWLHLVSVAYLLWLIVVLTYHHFANQKFAFISGLFLFIATILRYYVLYNSFTYGELQNLYFPSYFLVLITGLLFAVSLIFSDSIKEKWLKVAGVFSAVISIVLIVTLVGYLVTQNLVQKASFENWHNPISRISGLAILCYLFQFWGAQKKLNTHLRNAKFTRFLSPFMFLVSLVIILSSLHFMYSLSSEKPVARNIERRADHKDRAVAKRFEARMFVSTKKDTLLYRLLKPVSYDTSRTYPIVLCLHGGAGWGTDNIKQVQGALPAVMLSHYLVREQHPAFLFVPQITSKFSWGGLPKHTVVDSLVFQAMRSLEKEFNIDASRRYISGNSLGGYGTWHFIATRPEVFAAAIPISGEGDPKLAAKITNVPIWAFHGAKDVNVPVSGSRVMIDAIRKHGGNPRYTEYPDKDHDIWRDVVNTPHLIDWLFRQKNESAVTTDRL